MVDSLQARIERDARFASDVSHELRSPLTTLRSAVQIMEARRSDMTPRAARALDLLAVEVRRFDRLVQDLLEISRYDAGAARLELEDVDLPALAATVAREHQPDAEIVVNDGVTQVTADRRRLEQAIRNLVSNAIAHAGALDRIVIGATASTVQIAVEDAGPGVPEEDRSPIFDRFSRGRGSGRRSSGDGVGLGLALVAEHVRLQHGRVWVEDRDGGGARFVIELPRGP
jgi:two-component system sensor histidine kinase MtrB